jgi:hypothetical protein
MSNKEKIIAILQNYGYGVLDACPIADDVLKDWKNFEGKKKMYHIQIRPAPMVNIELTRE